MRFNPRNHMSKINALEKFAGGCGGCLYARVNRSSLIGSSVRGGKPPATPRTPRTDRSGAIRRLRFELHVRRSLGGDPAQFCALFDRGSDNRQRMVVYDEFEGDTRQD